LEQRRFFWRLVGYLYMAQVLSIALTPLVLFSSGLAILWPLLFVTVQVWLGWLSAARITNRPALQAAAAGVLAQLPGIISALVIFKGIANGYTTPDAFDFTIQIWYSAFARLSALLPHVQYGSVPLYFLVTLILPFIIPLLPACGALLIHTGARGQARPNQ